MIPKSTSFHCLLVSQQAMKAMIAKTTCVRKRSCLFAIRLCRLCTTSGAGRLKTWWQWQKERQPPPDQSKQQDFHYLTAGDRVENIHNLQHPLKGLPALDLLYAVKWFANFHGAEFCGFQYWKSMFLEIVLFRAEPREESNKTIPGVWFVRDCTT